MDRHATSDDHYVLFSEGRKSMTKFEMVLNGSIVKKAH
jgi:hypothetical protein